MGLEVKHRRKEKRHTFEGEPQMMIAVRTDCRAIGNIYMSVHTRRVLPSLSIPFNRIQLTSQRNESQIDMKLKMENEMTSLSNQLNSQLGDK